MSFPVIVSVSVDTFRIPRIANIRYNELVSNRFRNQKTTIVFWLDHEDLAVPWLPLTDDSPPLTVISGGQTGADQAGWRAARAYGVPTGGYMPVEFLTEAGRRPEFAEWYGARACLLASYAHRTLLNVRWADATVWFGLVHSRGYAATYRSILKCKADRSGRLEEPRAIWRVIQTPAALGFHPNEMAKWLRERQIRVLNITGNRESKNPGVGQWVEAYLRKVFRHMGYQSTEEGFG